LSTEAEVRCRGAGTPDRSVPSPSCCLLDTSITTSVTSTTMETGSICIAPRTLKPDAAESSSCCYFFVLRRRRRTRMAGPSMTRSFSTSTIISLLLACIGFCSIGAVRISAFVPLTSSTSVRRRGSTSPSRLWNARQQVSEADVRKAIDGVVSALRKDKAANAELGRLDRVTQVVGYGRPSGPAGPLNLRFNASFRKGGFGRSSVPMPFGLGQTNESEGRGTMVGQCKATVDSSTGKVTSCSVFRDLGYGRSFNLLDNITKSRNPKARNPGVTVGTRTVGG